MKKIRKLIACAVLFACASAWADSTPNVPVDDPVYRDIDKLVAAGLVKDAIYGQRPWNRGEIARMVAAAIRKMEGMEPVIVPDDRELTFRLSMEALIERLKDRFSEELVDAGIVDGETKSVRLHPLEEIRFDLTLLDSPHRIIPVDNGLSGVSARINPLVAYREGRHYADGITLGLETTHRARLSRFFSIFANPRFEALFPATGSSDFNPLIQKLYGKFNAGKFELEAGRDTLAWGQAEFGGLLLSSNARPLDMLRLGTSSPVFLPWIFRHLGPNGFQIFFADLGPEHPFPHAILSGYKWTIVPFRFWELGFNHVIVMGGDGADDPSFFGALGEFSGILSFLSDNNSGSTFTNRLLSLETRVTLPFLRNSVLYGEVGFDDTNDEIKVLLQDNALYLAGLYIPRLFYDGAADLRFEFRHIPAGAYRHFQYVDGYTLNRRFIGDELGPDGNSMLAKFNMNFAQNTLWTLQAAYENRDSDLFAGVPSPNGIGDIVKTQDNTTEHRIRIESAVSWNPEKRLRLKLDMGYEFCRNFNFKARDNAHHFRGGVTLTAARFF